MRAERNQAPARVPSRYASETRAETERRFVGGLLSAGDRGDDLTLAADALAICPAGSVASPWLCDVWDAVAEIHACGGRVDTVSVFDRLHTRYMRRELAADVDAASLTELTMTPFAAREGVLHFAAALAGMIRRDRMHQIFSEAATDCLVYGEDPDGIVARAEKALSGVMATTEAPSLAALLESVVADVASGVGARPMPTPWRNLNAVLKGGAVPGELVVLAGRPGLGKTALAGCWAVETARNVGPALFVSCEVKDKTIGARLLAREGRVDNRAFRQGLGRNPADTLGDIAAAADALSGLPLRIVDSSCRAVRPAEVARLARSVKGGVRLVVVDYLQLMLPDDKHDNREREIADMSRSMKRLAVELDCPVLLLAQLSRKSEDANREPQLSDLRESGAIEQDADVVIMLHSERRFSSEATCPVKALVRKGRSSGTGVANLIFDKAHSDFSVDESGEAWRQKHDPMPVTNDL